MTKYHLDAVKEALPHLGYSKSYLNTVRAALNKAPKVYKKPANKIHGCPDDFDRRFGDATNYVTLGFADLSRFGTWKTATRGAFERYQRWIANQPVQRPNFDDSWPLVLSFATNEAPDLGLATKRAWMQFTAFVAAAREDGIAPLSADTAFVHRMCDRKTYENRKQFLRGLEIWNALIMSGVAQTALAGLLPTAPAEPPRKQAPRSGYDGWLPAEAAVSLRDDFAAYVHAKRHGSDDDLDDEPLGNDSDEAKLDFTDNSAKAYGYAVGWVYRTLIRADLVDADDIDDLSELLTLKHIKSATRIFQEVRADEMSGLKSDASSLHSYVSKVTQIAIEHCDVSPETEKKMIALRKHPTVRGKGVGKMSAARRRRIEAFANDMAMQTKLLDAPEMLKRECQARLQNWGKMTQHARMRALKLGTAAAALTILLYGKPLREQNLRKLRAYCDHPTLILPVDFKGEACLDLPGEITKNGKPIAGELDPEAMPILRFYYEIVREKLIAEHPFGKHHTRSDFLFNSPGNDRAAEKSVLTALIGEGLAFCGLDMDTHEMRHAVAFFVLDEDPNAIEEAAELLDDHPDTVRKFYAWINKRKAHRSARAKLRAAKNKRLKGRVRR
jgi:hypothetical protein